MDVLQKSEDKDVVALLTVRESVSRLTTSTVIATVLIVATATTSCVFKFVKNPVSWTGPEVRARYLLAVDWAGLPD